MANIDKPEKNEWLESLAKTNEQNFFKSSNDYTYMTLPSPGINSNTFKVNFSPSMWTTTTNGTWTTGTIDQQGTFTPGGYISKQDNIEKIMDSLDKLEEKLKNK